MEVGVSGQLLLNALFLVEEDHKKGTAAFHCILNVNNIYIVFHQMSRKGDKTHRSVSVT